MLGALGVVVGRLVVEVGAAAIGYLLAAVFAYALLTLAYVAGVEYPRARWRARRQVVAVVERLRLRDAVGASASERTDAVPVPGGVAMVRSG